MGSSGKVSKIIVGASKPVEDIDIGRVFVQEGYENWQGLLMSALVKKLDRFLFWLHPSGCLCPMHLDGSFLIINHNSCFTAEPEELVSKELRDRRIELVRADFGVADKGPIKVIERQFE
jgi:hypothetical protein